MNECVHMNSGIAVTNGANIAFEMSDIYRVESNL